MEKKKVKFITMMGICFVSLVFVLGILTGLSLQTIPDDNPEITYGIIYDNVVVSNTTGFLVMENGDIMQYDDISEYHFTELEVGSGMVYRRDFVDGYINLEDL